MRIKKYSDLKDLIFSGAIIEDGGRIYLKDISVEQLIEVKKRIITEPEEIMTCRPVDIITLEESFKKYTESRNSSVSFDSGIFENGTNDLTGKISCIDFNPRNGAAEIGYYVIPEFRNKRYATEAIELMLKLLFQCEDVKKITAQTGSFNHGSVKILNKLKFHLDGKLRMHHKLNDEYFDENLFSILKHEYTLKEIENKI